MKAIILERRGEFAAALCEDGTIVKTRVSGEIGETVELAAETVAFPAKKARRWMRGAVAAALALAVTGGALGYMGTTASAYVSVDVEDTSVELAVNHFGRVIEVRAMNDGAQELAEQLRSEVRNQKVEDALDHTMERMHGERRASDGETAPVIVGVASDSDRWHTQLTQAAEQSAERAGEHAFYVSEASRAEREQALSQQQSIGRFVYENRDRDDPDDDDREENDRDDGNRDDLPSAQPDAPAFGASGSTGAQPPRDTPDDDRDDDDDSPSPLPPQAQNGGGQPAAPSQPPRDDDEDVDGDDAPPIQPSWQPRSDGGADDPDETDRPPFSPPDNGQQPPQDQPPQGDGQQEPPQGQPPEGGGPQPGEPIGAALRQNGAMPAAGMNADAQRFGIPQGMPDGFPGAYGAEPVSPQP